MSNLVLHKGIFITVTKWKDDEKDHSFFGEPLEVLAIQKNFISVRQINDTYIFPIDTNRACIMKLNDNYVLSFIKNKEVKKSIFSFLKLWKK